MIEPAAGPVSTYAVFGYGRATASVRSLASTARLVVLHDDDVSLSSRPLLRAPRRSLIRLSANRPRRSTSTATDTLSTESRLTADRRRTGSSMGSRTTSLIRPRIVVVQGATSARRSRGIAASRDKTTTGRLPASASSHHHTSPRAGSVITRPQQLAETRRGRPTRPARRAGVRRKPHSLRQLRRRGDSSAAHQGPHR